MTEEEQLLLHTRKYNLESACSDSRDSWPIITYIKTELHAVPSHRFSSFIMVVGWPEL